MTTPRRFAQDTKVPVIQTRGDIERLLGQHKAAQFGTAVDYEARTARVQFRLHDRIVRFTVALPNPSKYRGREAADQAERQKWRALLLVIKAKLEAVENAIATFEEEFLGYIVMPNDQTMAELAKPLVGQACAKGLVPRQLLQLPEENDSVNVQQLRQLETENHLLKVQARSDEAERTRLLDVVAQARVQLERVANALEVEHRDLQAAHKQLDAVRALIDRWRRGGLAGVAADAERALATGTH